MDVLKHNIRLRMKHLNLSNAQLAEKIGIKRQNVSQILNGETDLRLSTVKKLASALNIGVSDLFEENMTEASNNITYRDVNFYKSLTASLAPTVYSITYHRAIALQDGELKMEWKPFHEAVADELIKQVDAIIYEIENK